MAKKKRTDKTTYSVRLNKDDWSKVEQLREFYGLETIAPIFRMGVKLLYKEKIKNNKNGGKK